MQLRLGGVWPLSCTKTLESQREFLFWNAPQSWLTPDSQLSMLEAVYHKADETTVQKTFASVQQSLAAIDTHLGQTLNTRADHPGDREGAETCPRPEDINLEEVSIDFLRTYSVHSNWKQIISFCNDYGQTMAHISVTLGYLRLLRHLFTWEIDLNVMDNVGLTALHYAYLFKQEHCAKFLIQSGVNQFILDDLGRSPSDLDPSLEVRLHSIMDIESDSHTDGASPIEYDTEMQDKVGKLYAKDFLIQQWMRRDEDERRGEAPPSRYPNPDKLGRPRTANGPLALDLTDERGRDVTYGRFPSVGIRIPEENSTLIVAEEMDGEASIEIAPPPHIALPPSPEASAQLQKADRPSDIGQDTFSHPAPLDGAINTPDLERPQRNRRTRASHPLARREPSLVPTATRPLLPDTPKDIKEHNGTNDEKRLQHSTPYARPSTSSQRCIPMSTSILQNERGLDDDTKYYSLMTPMKYNRLISDGYTFFEGPPWPSSPHHFYSSLDATMDLTSASPVVTAPTSTRPLPNLVTTTSSTAPTAVTFNLPSPSALSFTLITGTDVPKPAMSHAAARAVIDAYVRDSAWLARHEMEPRVCDAGVPECALQLARPGDSIWACFCRRVRRNGVTIFKCTSCSHKTDRLNRAVGHQRSKWGHMPFACTDRGWYVVVLRS